MFSINELHEDCHQKLKENDGHGLICSSMRSGKTKMGIEWINISNPKKVLWVTNEEKLRDTITPNEFIKWRRKTLLKKVTFKCYNSLNKLDTSKFDLIVLDEYQHVTPKNTENLVFNKIIGLTGTHPDVKEKNEIFDKLGLKVIYDFSVDEASKAGIVSPYEIKVINFELDNKEKYLKHKSGLVTELKKYNQLDKWIYYNLINGKKSDYIYNMRMHLLYGLKSRKKAIQTLLDYNKGKRGLIFTPYKKLTEELCEYYHHSTSDNNHYDLFQQQKINQLGLVKKGGTGHTYYDLDFAIIGQTTSDKTGLTSQQWSRLLLPRENYKAIIYLLVASGTQDEKWAESALKNYRNIYYDNIKNYTKS